MMSRLYRWVVYIRRGYGSWVGFLISVVTLIAASYQPFYNSVHLVRDLAPSIVFWFVEVTITSLALCWVVGRWDYWHGTVAQEGTVSAKTNPGAVVMYRWMKAMAEGRTKDAADMMEAWVK